MPILDLGIRKAVRRNGAKLAVATARPTALDGGAAEAVRYAPGEATDFLDGLAADWMRARLGRVRGRRRGVLSDAER